MTIAASVPPLVRPVRRARPTPDLSFAVIDLETTGLEAGSERVLECAVLQTDARGRVQSEWSTLVTVPGSDELGAQSIHGISREMLAGAPQFREIASEFARRVSGRIVVGHVLSFDLEHLRAEFARAGACLPELSLSGLCTRELARDFLPPGPRTLAACCAAATVPLNDAHTALGDARAAAQLLADFINAGCPVDYEERARRARAVLWPRLAMVSGPRLEVRRQFGRRYEYRPSAVGS